MLFFFFFFFFPHYPDTIGSTSGEAVRGFLLQAWDPSDARIGTFTPGSGQQNLNCSSISIAIADAVSEFNTPKVNLFNV